MPSGAFAVCLQAATERACLRRDGTHHTHDEGHAAVPLWVDGHLFTETSDAVMARLDVTFRELEKKRERNDTDGDCD